MTLREKIRSGWCCFGSGYEDMTLEKRSDPDGVALYPDTQMTLDKNWIRMVLLWIRIRRYDPREKIVSVWCCPGSGYEDMTLEKKSDPDGVALDPDTKI